MPRPASLPKHNRWADVTAALTMGSVKGAVLPSCRPCGGVMGVMDCWRGVGLRTPRGG